LQTIKDDDTNPHFQITVLKEALNGNYQTFNDAYQQALTDYVDSGNCNGVAKQ
jgi:hypothetical protein